MLVGPFDRRKKRSRCQACATSHLKCSGQSPCANCERRRIACAFPGEEAAPQPFILVERGKQKTVANWSHQKKQQQRSKATSSAQVSTALISTRNQISNAVNGACLSSPCRLNDNKLRYLFYFDLFVSQNSFTGKANSYAEDIKQLPGLHASSSLHLTDAMLSLGALQALKEGGLNPLERRKTLSHALEYYSKSLIGLRDALAATGKGDVEVREAVLWSTLFLGLFELTNDVSGLGWRQHLIYGTAKALQATGPWACKEGPSLRFFIQARVVEICRTISFNEPSFLAQPEWMQLTRELSVGEAAQHWRPLDALLDVMVLCSNLRVRAAAFIEKQEESLDAEPTPEARSISLDGFSLRGALNSWNTYYSDLVPPSTTTDSQHLPPSPISAPGSGAQTPNTETGNEDKDDSMLLARVFFAATSIYLSGVFDYEIVYWRRLGLLTASLDETTIQRHVCTILELSSLALKTTRLSPLLFLFPMRIAGARAREKWQRDWILELVSKIRDGYAVAAAITRDLGQVWKSIPTNAESPPAMEEWEVESIPTLISYHIEKPRKGSKRGSSEEK